MARFIKKFNSFKEQEKYHLDIMWESSVRERFRRLYAMQQMTALLHPPKDLTRKIIIRKWTY